MIGKVIICGSESISYNTIVDILSKSSDRKVSILKINNRFTKFIVGSCNFINLGLTKKIGRQIVVLQSNNEYEISESSRYLNGFTNFQMYYKQGRK